MVGSKGYFLWEKTNKDIYSVSLANHIYMLTLKPTLKSEMFRSVSNDDKNDLRCNFEVDVFHYDSK